MPSRNSAKSADTAGAVYEPAARTAVTGSPALNPRTGEPTSGTGLDPRPDEGVDVLAVAMAQPPAGGAGEEDTEEGQHPTPQPRRGAVEAAVRYGIDVAARAQTAKVSGKAGELLVVEPPRDRQELPGRLIYVGVGAGTDADLRRAGAALARATMGAKRIRSSVVDGLAAGAQQAFLEGFFLGGYRVPRTGVQETGPGMAAEMELCGLDPEALRLAGITARATWLARDLTNTPADTATPEWMAAQARAVAARSGLAVQVRSEDTLRAEGFGGLTAVGSGSATPPRLVEVRYRPEAAGAAEAGHVVLVGKGITFDSGGLSLKPRESMVPMKMDMAGAAVVLAAVEAAAALEVPYPVTAVLALAENALGAGSYRPGDVISTYNGTTVEVGNTDAEGRLVLADALGYAQAELDPALIVDVATLTGAAALGLGLRYAALFGNNPQLLEDLERAGQQSGDPVWQLPLVPEYGYALDSEVADLAHVAAPKLHMNGGAVVAALFLEHFVGTTPWAHVDIAGPMKAGADTAELSKGATGFGTRLLISFLQAR